MSDLSGSSDNPFAAPGWALNWLRTFVDEADLRVVVVRDDDGSLRVVAPYFRRKYAIAGRPIVVSLQLPGTGRLPALTELPQALTARGQSRAHLRSVFSALMALRDRWDWIDTTLAPDQGWLEPDWVTPHRTGCTILPKGARACVVLDLPGEPDRLLPGLKRNVKESVRRSRNRLSRRAPGWRVSSEPGQPEALEKLLVLNQERSSARGRRVHTSAVSSVRERDFLRGLIASEPELAVPTFLHANGRPIAGLLALHAGATTYLVLPGFDQDWWECSPITALQAEVMIRAIDNGDRHINLSTGPDTAKLRWSEKLEVWQDFIVVHVGHRSHIAAGANWQASAAMKFRTERRRHRTAPQ